MWAASQQAGGVVPISSILSLFPFSPMIEGACVVADNCYASFSSFYINAFANKCDFVHLQQ
jgi:hypothetical protein